MTSKVPICLLCAVVFCAASALAQSPPPQPKLPQNPQPQVRVPQPPQDAVPPAAPYVPLSRYDKFHIFVRQTYSPYTFVSAGFNAAYGQMTGDPYEYGGGMAGFGRRFGASLANTEASRFFNRFLFPSLLHQDPRYFPAAHGTPATHRTWYAATRVLITRADSGKSQFNYSQMFGTICTVALENAYYPDRERDFGRTMNRFAGSLLSEVISNVTREFGPDMKRILRRHTPKRIREMQEKVWHNKQPPTREPHQP